jgi:hypothetical protein
LGGGGVFPLMMTLPFKFSLMILELLIFLRIIQFTFDLRKLHRFLFFTAIVKLV